MAQKKQDCFDRIQAATEAFLSGRKRANRITREKRRRRHPVADWAGALLWAIWHVLLANQYLLQAYVIPSGSMIDTLLVGDRIFVNKIVYGPELLPGIGKLPSVFKPERNEIIIFENPSHVSRGLAFDLAQRIIYMGTLSLVNIDLDETGQPRPNFLIKRAVGVAGDTFRMEDGEMRMRFAGDDRWTDERELARRMGWNHSLSRLMDTAAYPALRTAGQAMAWNDLRLPLPDRLGNAFEAGIAYPDYLALERARLGTLRTLRPEDSRYAALHARSSLGWYVPTGRIFPLGDNRDNSRDGRYFGPVAVSKVLGRGSFIYWPMHRAGALK
ncbi:MAG: signal peptidase I [Treponema sp.]|nr:signal peptidase I [Treponema sp.]